jgi:cytosine/uracil/thiamine/allantoin permease
MSVSSRRILFWAPRALGIAFALFIGMFATDVFNEGYSFWNTVLAFAIHLVPAAIVVVVLVLAWRWEWIGAVLFAAVGTLYMLNVLRHLNWILMISGPLVLIAALFLVSWLKRAELHPRPLRH